MECQNKLCNNPTVTRRERCPYCGTKVGRTRYPFERERILQLWGIGIVVFLFMLFGCVLFSSWWFSHNDFYFLGMKPLVISNPTERAVIEALKDSNRYHSPTGLFYIDVPENWELHKTDNTVNLLDVPIMVRAMVLETENGISHKDLARDFGTERYFTKAWDQWKEWEPYDVNNDDLPLYADFHLVTIEDENFVGRQLVHHDHGWVTIFQIVVPDEHEILLDIIENELYSSFRANAPTPTPTVTATWTYTPTTTLTPSNTPIFTSTNTLFPTFTSTHTLTVTSTQLPTNTSSPEPRCQSKTDFQIDDVVMVSVIDNINLRSRPSIEGELVGKVDYGARLTLTDGPRCADGYVWWEVQYRSSNAWIAEGSESRLWLIDPSKPVPTSPGSSSSSSSSSWPPSNRYRAPGNGVLLNNGVGLTNGALQNNGNFQVEGYCNYRGQTVSRDYQNWYCDGVALSVGNFDAICKATYNNNRAAAFLTGNRGEPSYNWRCYGPR